MKAWTLLPVCLAALTACGPKKNQEGSLRPRDPVTANKPLTLEEQDALQNLLAAAGRFEWMLAPAANRDNDPLVKEMKDALNAAGASKCARSGQYSDMYAIQAAPTADAAGAVATTPPQPRKDDLVTKEFAMKGSACPVEVKMVSTVNVTKQTFTKNIFIRLTDAALAQKNGLRSLRFVIRNGRVTTSGNKKSVAYTANASLERLDKNNIGLKIDAKYAAETLASGEVRLSGGKSLFSIMGKTAVNLRVAGDGTANIQYLLNTEPINAPTYEEFMNLLGPLLSGAVFENTP